MAHDELPHTEITVGPYSSESKAFVRYAGKHLAEQVITLPSMNVPANLIYTYLATSSGSVEMNTSGTTAAPYNYYWTVTSGHTAHVKSLQVKILDGSITPSKFGGLAALTNGLDIGFYGSTNNLLAKLTTGNIKNNGEFAFYGEVAEGGAS